MLDLAVLLPPGFDTDPRADSEAVLTGIVGLVWLACLAYAVRVGRRERTWLGVALLMGGGLAMLQEPMVDVNGALFIRSDITVFETYGREMPLWGLLAYSIYWGFFAWMLARQARRGMTLGKFRKLIVVGFVVNLFIEIPPLSLDLYEYFGNQPFEVAGLPLHWLPLNCASAVAIAAIVHRKAEWFEGPRAALAALLGMVIVPAASMGTGLPVFSALNHPGGPSDLAALGTGLLTIIIGLIVIDLCGRVLATPTAAAPDRERAEQAEEAPEQAEKALVS